jgi:hypothetical protein
MCSTSMAASPASAPIGDGRAECVIRVIRSESGFSYYIIAFASSTDGRDAA